MNFKGLGHWNIGIGDDNGSGTENFHRDRHSKSRGIATGGIAGVGGGGMNGDIVSGAGGMWSGGGSGGGSGGMRSGGGSAGGGSVMVSGGSAVAKVTTQWVHLKMTVMAKVMPPTTATNLAWGTNPFLPSQTADKASNTKAPQFHP